MDLDTFCLCSDHKGNDLSYTNIVQPFVYRPEAGESSDSWWSDFDEESSCSGDESSARICNTDLYAYFVLLPVYKYHCWKYSARVGVLWPLCSYAHLNRKCLLWSDSTISGEERVWGSQLYNSSSRICIRVLGCLGPPNSLLFIVYQHTLFYN